MIRYPGDLAKDALSPGIRFRGTSYFLGAIATGAVAAAIVLAMMLAHPILTPAASHPQSLIPLVKNLPIPNKMPFEMPSVPSLPGMPSNLSFHQMVPSLAPFEGLHLPYLDDIQIPLFSDGPEHA
jgi:hypothetical protein